jgi:5'-methylthioadenosine phosphorylase
MTAGPELALCRQMGIPYAVICAASNYAEGLVSGTPVTHELVLDAMQRTAAKAREIAWEIVRIAAAEQPSDYGTRQ